MPEKKGLSKTKIVLIIAIIFIFSMSMLVISIAQIVKIHELNDTIARQEKQIEELNSQIGE